MKNVSEKVAQLLNECAGSLPAYTSIGGYPLFYVDAGNNALCPTCAQENDAYTHELVDYDVNWEDDCLYCDHCSEQIASAYGED